MARTRVEIHAWDGEAALTLRAGDLAATFLPEVGMLGVSLRHRDTELVAMPKTVAQYRAGGWTGIPFLHPWANRLGERRFRVAGRTIDLRDHDVRVDGNGLPIHGTMAAQPFAIERIRHGARGARLDVSFDFGARRDLLATFPFPHRIDLAIVLTPSALSIGTAITPTTRRPVPVSFGWHPYLQLPESTRDRWRLRMPPMRRAVLGPTLLPTGDLARVPETDEPIGERTYDDHFVLGHDRRFVLADRARRVTIGFDPQYRRAQIYVPPGGDFVCIEPMVAGVNALVEGTAPIVAPDAAYRARFSVGVERI